MKYIFLGKFGKYYKTNANCKQEEKSGTGPGSCGGKIDTIQKDVSIQSASVLSNNYKVNWYRKSKLKREGGVKLPNDNNINKLITLTSNKITNSLSTQDRAKIRQYTGTWGYIDVDNYLNIDHSHLTPEELKTGKEITDILDRSIEKSFIPKGTLLWKGINNANSKIPIEALTPGKEFSYKGFNSASLSPDVAQYYSISTFGGEYSKTKDPIIVEISYPKDGKGLYLNSKSTMNEPYDKNYDHRIFEVILPRNQKFKVLSVTDTEYGKVVKWEVV